MSMISFHEPEQYSSFRKANFVRLVPLVEARDWISIIDACSGHTGHCTVAALWSLAMTAAYGPPGLHESRMTGGKPDHALCSDIPSVFERMRNAEKAISNIVLGQCWL